MSEKVSSSGKRAAVETLLEWFDRSVERELKKRREARATKMPDGSTAEYAAELPARSIGGGGTTENLAGTMSTRYEICSQLRGEMGTELSEAVDRLAQAEAICSFAGVLNAAERAAQGAPQDKEEIYALAAASGFESHVTGRIQSHVTAGGGERPIEVIGYVGVTKPHQPKPIKSD